MKKPCITCGSSDDSGFKQCDECFKIRGKMPLKHFEANIEKMHNFIFENKRVNRKMFKTHQMCKRKNCNSSRRYKDFYESQNLHGGTTDYDKWFDITNGDCFYCGSPPPNGVDRKNSDRGYFKNNIVSCCSVCNYMKGDMNLNDFKKQVKKIHRFTTSR